MFLRDDLNSSAIGNDTWSVIGFDLAGSYNGNHMYMGPDQWVTPSQQSYIGLSIADEGFFALRDMTGYSDSYMTVGFDFDGSYNGVALAVAGAPSIDPIDNIAAFNMSPYHLEYAYSNFRLSQG